MNYLIFEDNGNVLWTESIRAASDEEAIEKAATLFENLTPEEKKADYPSSSAKDTTREKSAAVFTLMKTRKEAGS